jgi:hypothetical protein
MENTQNIVEAIEVSNNTTLSNYWKSHDIMKGISNISAA